MSQAFRDRLKQKIAELEAEKQLALEEQPTEPPPEEPPPEETPSAT